jgi:hypothetical protein
MRQILDTAVNQLLFEDDIEGVGETHFRSILLSAQTLLTLKKELNIRGCNKRQSLRVILLEPALRVAEKVAECSFLEEDQDDLKGDQHCKDDNDMADLELVSRELGPDVLRKFRLKSCHGLAAGELTPFGFK